MKEQIKELRVKIDGLAQLTKELKPNKIYSYYITTGQYTRPGDDAKIVDGSNSKEIEKAIDSLYLAKAWLGKCLGELGNDNPYGSGYKTVEDIVPTQDVYDSSQNIKIGGYYDYSHIEKVDWLRTEIGKIFDNKLIGDHSEIKEPRELSIDKISTYASFYKQHIGEARFWLGFELARYKTELI